MRRMLATALAGCLVLSVSGCFSVRSRAEWKAAKIEEGMERERVRKKLGDPMEKLPVPGQGDDPRLVVELWRYDQKLYFAMTLTIVLTFGLGLIFMDLEYCYFDVGFGRDGRVLKISEVHRERK